MAIRAFARTRSADVGDTPTSRHDDWWAVGVRGVPITAVSNHSKMCDRLHTYRIDVGSCSGNSTKLAATGGEVAGVRHCLASGVSGRRLQSPRLRGRSRLGTASACYFLQGEYGGAGDIADNGKRQAIEQNRRSSAPMLP